jgi:hypothetical protein
MPCHPGQSLGFMDVELSISVSVGAMHMVLQAAAAVVRRALMQIVDQQKPTGVGAIQSTFEVRLTPNLSWHQSPIPVRIHAHEHGLHALAIQPDFLLTGDRAPYSIHAQQDSSQADADHAWLKLRAQECHALSLFRLGDPVMTES